MTLIVSTCVQPNALVTITLYCPASVSCIFVFTNGFVIPVAAGPVHAYVAPATGVLNKFNVSPSHKTVSPVIFATGLGFTVITTGAIEG